MPIVMSSGTEPQLLEVQHDKSDIIAQDIILYHGEVPVIKVQHGTTFGLTKMLYESLGRDGRIIGLRPRLNVPSLACIITQDQTVLTESEYDVIVYGGKTVQPVKETKLPSSDKSVNTLLTFHPKFIYENGLTTSGTARLSKERSEKSADNAYLEDAFRQEGNSTVHQNDNVDMRSVFSGSDYVVSWNCSGAERQAANELTGPKNFVVNGHAEQDYAMQYARNSQDNTSTGTVVSDTDSRSSEGSVKCSPSQVYRPPFYRRKPSDEESETEGKLQQSEGKALVECIQDVSSRRKESRKWQCSHCQKCFLCRSALENHARIHTGEKPFQCTDCGRCFSHQGNLKQHLHIHREVKPHVCNICGKGFTRSNRLRDHMLAHDVIPEKNCEIRMRTKVEWRPVENAAPWQARTSEAIDGSVDVSNTMYNEFQETMPSTR